MSKPAKPKPKDPTLSKGTVGIKTIGSTPLQPRQRIAQNFLLIWVDTTIDESKKDCQNTLTQLRSIVNDIKIFTQPDQSIEYLNDIEHENIFLITSASIGQQLIPKIHNMSQLDTIYIFCRNKSSNATWIKQWIKIKDIYTDIKPICQALQQAIKEYNQNSIAVSFVTVNEQSSSQNLNQLEASFMYTQIFKEILINMDYNEQSIQDLATYCRELYHNNRNELAIIDEFERNYRSTSAIWWYTRECFTYQMLNRSLRVLEADTMINMGFFIRDLHQQIQELYRNQIDSYDGKSFLVYRGQGLLKTDFEKLQKSKGGLISFNNFLSTSIKRETSLGFAMAALGKSDTVGILFRMTIHPSISSAPFASIRDVSYYQTEDEILFSMHTVFRIDEISQIKNHCSLYQVDLQLTADDDPDLRKLTDHIREEVQGETGWMRLGVLLVKAGQFAKAEELYNILIERTSNEGDKTVFYNNLGYIKNNQGDHTKAIEYYEKVLDIKEKSLPANDPSLATSYNNIGLVYMNIKDYSKALSFYEKALQIKEKSLPTNHPSLATSYSNIAGLYESIKENSKALSFYEKAFDIDQKTLPPNHPSLATSYSNIAGLYDTMDENAKALSFYEKALQIKEKTLPWNHPSLGTTYNNIGFIYRKNGEYLKALSSYQNALKIFQNSLPSNHPHIKTTEENIEYVKHKLSVNA